MAIKKTKFFAKKQTVINSRNDPASVDCREIRYTKDFLIFVTAIKVFLVKTDKCLCSLMASIIIN